MSVSPVLRFSSPGFWLLPAGLFFSILLVFFGLNNYRSSWPIAEGMLRGQALTLAATIETLAGQDASFDLLSHVESPDIAFYSIIDDSGVQLFHTNQDLIGSSVGPDFVVPDFTGYGFRDRRLVLGTGEEVFEFLAPVHVVGHRFTLRMVLHTYQADAVVRRAQTSLAVLSAMLVAGWVMGLLLYIYDRRATRHRQEMAEQWHLAQLGTLSAVLAHEVRNPLSGIKGYAQLLEESLDDKQMGQYANQVVTEAMRLEELVNDLLAYAQPSITRVEPVDLHFVVDQAIDLLAKRFAEENVQLVCRHDGWPHVLGDVDRLQQLLLNLFLNALQATPAGGVVTVSIRHQGSYMELAVSDTGKGIDPQDLPHIFEPFFTRRARGTGLGLAICKKFIEDMNGTVKVTSIPGQGSTFTLNLAVAGKKPLRSMV
jgi:two-component system sensor histidine kinase HydH